ncbi:hypothetical protein SAMN05428942_7260 [Streptomyces sp. 2112.2]|uniref:hypothetical protein n=1 Tax=Streptomyces sp. 2112.2 TaxID=1881024 RepID=UPI000896C333|nr:hypothetical protein [Streptomyces sp. 2112.2]SEF16387.1 hypothetical protein SAMN05428942_7260 [Streptomyces sp. 2112.2]
MTDDALTADELNKLLGPDAAGWPALGLTATRDGDRVTVRWNGEIVGYTEPSAEFPGRTIYKAVVTTAADGRPFGVGFPAGMIANDPLWFQHSERRRWLPADHPDYPTAPLPMPGPGVVGPRGADFWAALTAAGTGPERADTP